jgi:hypothetical protein
VAHCLFADGSWWWCDGVRGVERRAAPYMAASGVGNGLFGALFAVTDAAAAWGAQLEVGGGDVAWR